MKISGKLYQKGVWCAYVFYLFSIVAFGDRVEYYIISNISFLILIGLMLGKIIASHDFKLPVHLLIFLPFVIYNFVSCLWSRDLGGTIVRSVTVLEVFVLQVIATWYLERTGEISDYILGIAVAGIIIALYVVNTYGISRLQSMISDDLRVGGEVVNENTLAIFLALSAVILFFKYIEAKNILYIVIFVILVVLNVITGSKKGLIDLVVGIALVLFFASVNDNEKRNKFIKWFTIIIGIVVVTYFVWQLPIFDIVRERFDLMFGFLGGTSAKIDYSTRERQQMIEEGLKQFHETPILGIGIGATSYITMQFLGRATYLHNNYVELLASGGLIGTLLYYVPILKVGVENWKNRKKSIANQFGFIIVVIIIINDFAAVQYFSKISYVLFAIVIASANVEASTRSKCKE